MDEEGDLQGKRKESADLISPHLVMRVVKGWLLAECHLGFSTLWTVKWTCFINEILLCEELPESGLLRASGACSRQEGKASRVAFDSNFCLLYQNLLISCLPKII